MRKTITSIIIFLYVCSANAQKGMDNLIQAEKNFAAYAVANSIKEAFLKFPDSSGVVFSNGKAVNGIDFWSSREKRPGILNWRPLYAGIAASEDFGFTTGPWTFQPNTIKDTIIARGQYTTLWHIDKTGNWKFLVDLGAENTPANKDTSIQLIYQNTGLSFYPGSLSSLVKTEQKFIKETGRGRLRKKGYDKYISTHFILNRNNRLPATNTDQLYEVINEMPASVEYKITGSGIAASGDLGYVFGATVINGKTENYLRIWRNEKKGWRIAVEVVLY